MPPILDELRLRTPSVYKAGMWLRGELLEVAAMPRRRRAEAVLRGPAVTVEIAGRVGLGGLFSNAARALAVGEARGTAVSLRFTAPLYMPSAPVEDWLDSYFVRTGLPCSPELPVLEAGELPSAPAISTADGAGLLWSYMQIHPDIASSAAPYMEGAYAAVHFRGSDKYLEAAPVSRERVLDRVEAEMRERGIERLFVASDEPAFIAEAFRRFGPERCFSLPQLAVAADGRPPHFSDVPGEVKATEALQTMLVLSGAQVCVRTASLLSEWSQTLAPQGHDYVLVQPAR
jgi:hypothetical protein